MKQSVQTKGKAGRKGEKDRTKYKGKVKRASSPPREITLREHLTRIGALGGKAKAKPTKCARCGKIQPTARAAWVHCRKPRAKKKAA